MGSKKTLAFSLDDSPAEVIIIIIMIIILLLLIIIIIIIKMLSLFNSLIILSELNSFSFLQNLLFVVLKYRSKL